MAMEIIEFHRDLMVRPARSPPFNQQSADASLAVNMATLVWGDLRARYHHQPGIRKRICDQRFLDLLWKLLKAGCIDKGLFCAAHEGVPQGGVLSPLLSNIMLNEFDQWLENRYLCKKARKDRWSWNFSLNRPIAAREGRKWLPAVSYSRYADDFVVIVKGTKQQAEVIREECRQYLENQLKLQLNMDKTALTHVNDGFTFLGHRIIRKRGPKGNMRTVTQIPIKKFQSFATKLSRTIG